MERGGVPGWAKVFIAGSLVLCVGCAALVYFVARPLRGKFEDSTTKQIASMVYLHVVLVPLQGERLVLREADLDVNNGFAGPGEWGVRWGSDGTTIYGFETGIDPSGISLGTNGSVMYRGFPVVANGQVDLSAVEEVKQTALKDFVLSNKSFEQGLERGINRALAERKLKPTGITLSNGSLIILVVPVESAAAWRRADGRDHRWRHSEILSGASN